MPPTITLVPQDVAPHLSHALDNVIAETTTVEAMRRCVTSNGRANPLSNTVGAAQCTLIELITWEAGRKAYNLADTSGLGVLD